MIEACLVPILFHGYEKQLSCNTTCKLDLCLGSLAKRALRWPVHNSNTAAMTAMCMESAGTRIPLAKLRFFRRLKLDDAEGIGAVAWSMMMMLTHWFQ